MDKAMEQHTARAPNVSNNLAYRESASAPNSALGFNILLLLTAVVFLRPAEILPALENLPIYEVIIIICTLASLPAILRQLQWSVLKRHPWTLPVLGLLLAIVLTGLSKHSVYAARTAGLDFAKVLIYYLLVVGLVDSPRRLHVFVLAVAIFVTATATLALLQYHGLIDLPSLAPMLENEGGDEPNYIVRLMATGFFHDPNDFSLVLGVAIMVGLYCVVEQKRWLIRIAWLAATGVLTYALLLTGSRGGFLALLGGGAVLTITRFGWRRSILIGALALPIVLFLFGGRQTAIDINDKGDTAQGRILLWRDSLMLFRAAPVFGIGVGGLAEENGLVAHNSYVHAFTELGFVGGTLFIGSLYIPLVALRKVSPNTIRSADPEVLRWRPYILALTVAYAVGLFTLSRCYSLPTYLVLGAMGAFCNVLSATAPAAFPQLSRRLVGGVVMASLAGFTFLYLFVKVFAH
jgi:O-antigen ligase